MKTTEWLSKKIQDYQRFVMTLLIMSSYLYAGTLISIFEYKTQSYLFLYPIIAIALFMAFLMTLKVKRWKRHLIEN
ncbi:YrhC family protein [Halobacillus litoralis]|uniref:YrhC family protein n=1 Tax=Halobacillus litoralis TaxID=45668 RepID=UPI001CFCB714|nr:YrhC family protein [Halobacillus litoralis]